MAAVAKEGTPWRDGDDSDAEGYRQLFEHLCQPVVWYFRKRGFSAEEAQDLTQGTFVKAFDGWRDSGTP